MELYAGLDVSMDETSICVLDREGKIIKECKTETEPTAIRPALDGYADRLHRVGLEAQAFSPWLFTELHRMGLPAIVVEAPHMQKALSAQRNKMQRKARPLLREPRIAADDQPLIGVIGRGDLGEIALIKQRKLQHTSLGEAADRRRSQSRDEVETSRLDGLLQSRLGDHPAIANSCCALHDEERF